MAHRRLENEKGDNSNQLKRGRQAHLADTRVADQQKLEKVVILRSRHVCRL